MKARAPLTVNGVEVLCDLDHDCEASTTHSGRPANGFLLRATWTVAR